MMAFTLTIRGYSVACATAEEVLTLIEAAERRPGATTPPPADPAGWGGNETRSDSALSAVRAAFTSQPRKSL